MQGGGGRFRVDTRPLANINYISKIILITNWCGGALPPAQDCPYGPSNKIILRRRDFVVWPMWEIPK